MKNDWSLHGARLRSEKPKWLREMAWDPLVGPPKEDQRGGPKAPKKPPDRKQYLGKNLLQPQRRNRRQVARASAWANAPGRGDLQHEKDGPTGQYNVHYECVQPRAPCALIMAPTATPRRRPGSRSPSPEGAEAGGSPQRGASSPGRQKAKSGRPATSSGVPDEGDRGSPRDRAASSATPQRGGAGGGSNAEEEEEEEAGADGTSPERRRSKGGLGEDEARAKSSTPGPGGVPSFTPRNLGQVAVWGQSPGAIFGPLSARKDLARESPWEPGDLPDGWGRASPLSTTPRAPAFRIPQGKGKQNTTRAAVGSAVGGTKTPGAHYQVDYSRLSSERRVTSGVNFGGQTGREQAVSHKAGASASAAVGYWDKAMAGLQNERMRVHGCDDAVKGGQRLVDRFVPGNYVANGVGFGATTGRDVLTSFDVERSGIRDMSDAPEAPFQPALKGLGGTGRTTTKADTWYAWRNETPQPTGMALNAAVDMQMMTMRDLRGRPKRAGAMAAAQALHECQRVTEWFEFRVGEEVIHPKKMAGEEGF